MWRGEARARAPHAAPARAAVIEGLTKKRTGLTKDEKEELEVAGKVKEWVEAAKDVRMGDWSAKVRSRGLGV